MTEPAETCDGLAESAAPAADLPRDVPALKMFYLYLSAGCNLHCRHCWITPTFVQGQPVPGASVRVSDCRGRLLAQAQTDAPIPQQTQAMTGQSM